MREGVEELTGEEGWCWQRLLSACRPDFSPLYARFAAFPADFAADFLRHCGNHQGGGVHIALHPAADRQKSDRKRNKESEWRPTYLEMSLFSQFFLFLYNSVWYPQTSKAFIISGLHPAAEAEEWQKEGQRIKDCKNKKRIGGKKEGKFCRITFGAWTGKKYLRWKTFFFNRNIEKGLIKYLLEKEYFTCAGGAMDNNLK